MRKHFAPYGPVVIGIRPNIEPVADVFLLEDGTHPFIVPATDIVFAGAQHNTHFPEIGIVVVRNIVHRIIKINGIVVESVGKLCNIKSAAHGKTIA